jgi:hypothetical protein
MLSPSRRRLVLLGATGAVGGHVLAEALRSPAFETVTTLGRRTADVAGPSRVAGVTGRQDAAGRAGDVSVARHIEWSSCPRF